MDGSGREKDEMQKKRRDAMKSKKKKKKKRKKKEESVQGERRKQEGQKDGNWEDKGTDEATDGGGQTDGERQTDCIGEDGN